ncbi:TPA: hypothetical protein ACKRTE_002947 [Providencia rettgeri]
MLFFQKKTSISFFVSWQSLIKTRLAKYIKVYFLFICYSLSSCAAHEKPKDISLDDVAIMLTESSASNENISSNESGCLDMLDFLMKENTEEYTNLAGKFNELTDGYRFLNENRDIMDKDAKEMYLMTLSMKKEYLCYTLRFSSFKTLKNKMKI